MPLLRLFLLATVLSACATPPRAGSNPADDRLKALYEREWAWRQEQEAQIRDEDDDWTDADHWPDVSAAAYAERLQYWEDALDELAAIPRDELGDEQRINAAVFEQIVTTLASDVRYRTFEAPLNSDSFFWGNLHPQRKGFDDLAGYERYLGRMRDLPRYFGEHMDNMRAGLARGFTPPAITLAGRDASIEPYVRAGRDNPFFVPLEHFPSNMSDAERERIEAEALAAIDDAVVPA